MLDSPARQRERRKRRAAHRQRDRVGKKAERGRRDPLLPLGLQADDGGVHGLPTLVLDGDGCDSRNVADGQMVTRVGAFLEQLEGMDA